MGMVQVWSVQTPVGFSSHRLLTEFHSEITIPSSVCKGDVFQSDRALVNLNSRDRFEMKKM